MADQIETLLIAASRADRSAEQTLENYLNENYGEFCRALCTIIADEQRPYAGRQMGCLYFKNTLAAQSSNIQIEKHDRWKALAPDIRREIKEKLMQTLRNTNQQGLSHFCALVAAEIAVVELPFKEWPEFVAALAITSTPNIDESIKIAALECLGYTCERLAMVEEMVPNVPELATGTVDAMLTTIVDGVQPNKSDHMRKAALQALKNSLFYIRKNMETKAERDFIMQAVTEASRSQQPEVRALSLKCLDTICDQYYDFLGDYMTHIYNLTTEAIKADPTEEVKMSAIEVWSTLATVEQDLLFTERQCQQLGLPLERPACPNYVMAASEHLMPLLLETLMAVDEDSLDEESWTLQASASNCIEIMSVAIGGRILNLVIPFVQANIQAPEWQKRDAAIVAFMSIQEGPTTEEIGTFVVQSLEVMIKAFNDSSPVVQSSAVHCVGLMCSLHLVALPQTAIHGILQAFLAKLPEGPAMSSRCCTGIFNIATAVGKESPEDPLPSNVLSGPMLPLMQALLGISDRPDGHEHNLRVAAMSAAAALVSASAMDAQPIFRDLLPYIIDKTKTALSMQVISPEEGAAREQILGSFCGLFQTLYQRMDKSDVKQRTDEVMNLLIQILQVRNVSCHEEAFFAIGAVAANVEEDFEKYMQAFTPLLVQGLKSFSVESLVSVCVGVVVDICAAIGHKFQPYADAVVQVLMECLRDGSVVRDVKPTVVSAFGDIAIAIQGAYEPYLQVTLMLLMQASQQTAESPEMIDFINTLRCSILEAYSGITVGLSEGNRADLFVGSVPAVLQFLNMLANDPTKDDLVLQKAVALLGDLANEMGGQVKMHLQQPFVAQLIQSAEMSQDEQVRQYAEWSMSKLQAL